MPLTLQIPDRIIRRTAVQRKSLAEIIYIELHLTPLPLPIGQIEVCVHLVVNIFYVLQCRERNCLQLMQPFHIGTVPQKHRVRILSVTPGPARFLEICFR